jgi:hypothetical protein
MVGREYIKVCEFLQISRAISRLCLFRKISINSKFIVFFEKLQTIKTINFDKNSKFKFLNIQFGASFTVSLLQPFTVF